MYGRIVSWLSIFLLLICLASGEPGQPLSRLLSLYQRSDQLFHLTHATPANDSTALAGFEAVIAEVGKIPVFAGRDTLLFQSWLKKAILLDSRNNYVGAKNAYRHALGLHHQPDSLLFVTYINTGGVYYNLNHFDSANYFLLRADSMKGSFRDKDDEVRLCNTLGVLYFDNGNFRQGKNYFSRALEIVEAKKPVDPASAAGLRTNIATSYYHLEQYEEALAIYKKVLSEGMISDYVYINMGNAYLGLNRFQEALACFRQVHAGRIPSVLNEMGYAQLQLHRPDSCAWFLDQLLARQGNRSLSLNDLDLGTNYVYRADLQASRQDYMPALSSLQQALSLFSRNFSTQDIYTNPSSFTGTFANYRLYDALLKKAEVFRLLYEAQPGKAVYLQASFGAYQAALSLLRTIEKSYDTDDAKLFLKKKSGQAYEGALSVGLELSALHGGGNYTEQAFMISEKSKASIITANLQQKNFVSGIDVGLLQEERNIKYNIARLNVRSEETSDKKELEVLGKEKADDEIALSKLQKQLEQNSAYYKLKYEDGGPGVGELQQQLESNQALISFYATGSVLYAFTVTSSSFSYTRIDSLSRIRQNVEAWLTALKMTGNGKKFRAGKIGVQLYQLLVKPIQENTGRKDEWIIIPDGFLYFLPFESLPADEEGTHTLLETTTISYRFSSRLLHSDQGQALGAPAMPILSFAPFVSSGAGSRFPALPASGEEIAGLQGTQYINARATKEQFLQEINKYPIVHLATHAISSPENAAASFIAFYPVKRSAIEDCLFLEELYGLDLNATRLVIISACETGQGELVAREGVISLARAFTYAGCGSTINSLWKADDRSTAYILRRFYMYLRQGANKAKALQQAKLDYLNSDAINKSPAFWAHLILMGDTGPLYAKKVSGWWWLLVPLAGIVMGMIWLKRRKK
jgi:CHAT domain-containing protein